MAHEVRELVQRLQLMGRNDLLLQAITVPVLEELRTEAARGTLSKLIVTSDYRLFLADGMREVELTPIHRAVYLLFLNHPEGIEFKLISDYRNELLSLYHRVSPDTDIMKLTESVARLTNPLDNSLNEKCARIRSAFCSMMDEYSASYYIIGSKAQRIGQASARRWFRRLKVIALPRELVLWDLP